MKWDMSLVVGLGVLSLTSYGLAQGTVGETGATEGNSDALDGSPGAQQAFNDGVGAAVLPPGETQEGWAGEEQIGRATTKATGRGTSLFAGASIGPVLPSGKLESDEYVGEYIGAGGGLGAHVGLRFARHFGLQAFYEHYAFAPGEGLDKPPAGLGEVDQFEVVSSVGGDSFGMSFLAGSEPGRFGGYGELGLAYQQYDWERKVTGITVSDCVESMDYGGPSARLGGGFVLPVHAHLQLTAMANYTLGMFTGREFHSNCGSRGNQGRDFELPALRKELHHQLFFGIGADFTMGL